ncbi:hypothetical protein IAR55_002809 [Kwoniella newhampshirensis]|uniref:Leucine-rich repeat-containing N-terminal plant-type domain-containing protein n=1 Tax=Kwoniella newhampshirensis TaxID=1651941 RepID=A0AAW0Z1F8_9TREE
MRPSRPFLSLSQLSVILFILSTLSNTTALQLTPEPSTKTSSHRNRKQSRSYLSSSKRASAPRRFGYFSFSRHPSSLPPFDPRSGVDGVLVHRGVVEEYITGSGGFANELQGSLNKVETGGGGGREVVEQLREGGGDDPTDDTFVFVERSLDDQVEPPEEEGIGCEKREEASAPLTKNQSTLHPSSSTWTASLNTTGRPHSDKVLWSPLTHDLPSGLVKRRKDYNHQDQDEGDGGSGGGGERLGGGEWDDGPRRHSGKKGKGEGGDDDDDTVSSPDWDDGRSSHGQAYGVESKSEYDSHQGSDVTDGPEDQDDSPHNVHSNSATSRPPHRGSSSTNALGPNSYSHNTDPDPDPDADALSAQTHHADTPAYSGGGAHRLAQSAYGSSAKSDCSRLSQFYRAMSPPSGNGQAGWTRSDGWEDEDDTQCCHWSGVTCEPVTERVVALDLADNGLSGTLSGYLFALDRLSKVDLSSNNLISIPDRFTTLPHLSHLNLSASQLTGTIPTSLFTSTSVINVDLSHNNLTGHVDIASPKLLTLNLEGNKLQGITFDTSQLGSLSKVLIGENSFVGVLPDLSMIEGLSVFDASNNNTGPLFDISQMLKLTGLDLRSNSISGPFPTLPPSLTSLHLSSNAFTGPIPILPAPVSLTSCYVLPNAFSPCPSAADLADPNSLASKCHLSSCGVPSSAPAGIANVGPATAVASTSGIQGGNKGPGIPVSPLPGETLDAITPSALQNPVPVVGQVIVPANGHTSPGQAPGSQSITGQGAQPVTLNAQHNIGWSNLSSASSPIYCRDVPLLTCILGSTILLGLL